MWLLADMSYTCRVSWTAMSLGGPTASWWCWRWVLLLVQLPISQRVHSGAPRGAALRTPYWVSVTPVKVNTWEKKMKEKELRKKKKQESGNHDLSSLYGEKCMKPFCSFSCLSLLVHARFLTPQLCTALLLDLLFVLTRENKPGRCMVHAWVHTKTHWDVLCGLLSL